ncbi:MAG: hypothetical protein HC860_22990 [Alkalinema sp. RU_4_3]|nr:hypothetical protein [Alkalinema sp. RU_4_3]
METGRRWARFLVANELLTTPGTPQAKAASEGYKERYDAYVARLTALAENITYDKAERDPIIEVQTHMGNYIRLAQQARDLKAQGNQQAAMLSTYQDAMALMDDKLLPQIDQLSKVNKQEMDKQIAGDRSGFLQLQVMVIGLLLVATLVALQLYLVQRTKRQFNPALIAATSIAGLFLLHSALALGKASGELKVMRDDAFPSLYSIRKARSLSYQANADESRYLLDKTNAATHEDRFKQRVKDIMYIPRDLDLETINRKINTNAKADLNRVKGLVAGAVSNVTFPGEGPALIEALRAWQNYVDVDAKIREKERSGDRQGAINICLGESDDAYGVFKKKLEKVQVINEDAMKESLDKSDRALAYFEVQAAIALLLVAGLTQYGLKARIKEYQV